ncbi:hypothetical protein [Corynebacterium ulceribovis]|uniref:hypothetical protein n=1 Tax=Corynebacterium ulceribovis TaxID=487732 RepID=UPI000376946E|nr:hypothetical protein [Corynebacterium ulceribovis]
MTYLLMRRQFHALTGSWTLWVLVIASAIFALLAPISAYYLPEILAQAVGSDGLINTDALPEPTSMDAWMQWASNLNQLLAVLVAVVAAGSLGSDLTRGTALAVLSHEVPRSKLAIAAVGSVSAIVFAVISAATAIVLGVTSIFFNVGWADLKHPILLTIFWLLFACSIIVVAVGTAALGAATLGSAAAGVAYIVVCAALQLIPSAAKWSPAGLTSFAQTPDAGIPWTSIAITGVLMCVFLAVCLKRFQVRDLN